MTKTVSPLFAKKETISPYIAVRFKKLHGDAQLPSYATPGAAGADVRACFEIDTPVAIAPGERRLIPTGLACEIPEGIEIQVRPRSGLALKHGVTVLNSPGTIDSDYRGPLGVILHNTSDRPFQVLNGERIAQIVIAPVIQAAFEFTDALSETERGTGAFGSTGTH